MRVLSISKQLLSRLIARYAFGIIVPYYGVLENPIDIHSRYPDYAVKKLQRYIASEDYTSSGMFISRSIVR